MTEDQIDASRKGAGKAHRPSGKAHYKKEKIKEKIREIKAASQQNSL